MHIEYKNRNGYGKVVVTDTNTEIEVSDNEVEWGQMLSVTERIARNGHVSAKEFVIEAVKQSEFTASDSNLIIEFIDNLE